MNLSQAPNTPAAGLTPKGTVLRSPHAGMKRAAFMVLFAVVGFALGVTIAVFLSTLHEQPRATVETGMADALFWLEIVCPIMGLLGAFAGAFVASRRFKKHG